MRGLTIIVSSADGERFHAALSVAAAHAALERPTRLFLQGEAVTLLRSPIAWNGDVRHSEAGLPTLSELLGEAMALGATVSICQSGLSLAGMSAEDLPPGIETGGLVGMLATAGDDQIVMA
jgi:predicted peroxiredoxin